jgi:hypothetical protein
LMDAFNNGRRLPRLTGSAAGLREAATRSRSREPTL